MDIPNNKINFQQLVRVIIVKEYFVKKKNFIKEYFLKRKVIGQFMLCSIMSSVFFLGKISQFTYLGYLLATSTKKN
jgi:hypothetical protein